MEYSPILFVTERHLKSRFATLSSRVAAFSMSNMDFIGTLRNIAAPILRTDVEASNIVLKIIGSPKVFEGKLWSPLSRSGFSFLYG